jgi:uncharacterized membrane protein YgcG
LSLFQKKKKSIFILIWGLWVAFSSLSAQVPDQPVNYITDVTDLLTEDEENTLNAELRTFEDSTTHQIFVLLTQSLEGRNIEEVTLETAMRWGVGQEGQDNGLLIAIYADDRQMRFEVGYGLEAELTDYETQRIQQDYMIPFLKNQDYFGAIQAGILYSMEEIKNIEQVSSITPRFSFDRKRPENEFWPIISEKEGYWYINLLYIGMIILGLVLLFHYFIGQGIQALGERLKNKWTRWGILWGMHAIFYSVPFLFWDTDYNIYLLSMGNLTNIGYLLAISGFFCMNTLSSWMLIASEVYVKKDKKKKVRERPKKKKEYQDFGVGKKIYYYIVNLFRSIAIWIIFSFIVFLFIGEGNSVGEVLKMMLEMMLVCGFLMALYDSLLGWIGGGSFSSGSGGFFGGSFSSGGGSSSGGSFGGGGGGSFGGGGSSSSW